MPLGIAMISDQMQFPSGNGEFQNCQWFPDERDGFISWLRGEFAAANAVIDLLCNHLKNIGEPGEYDIAINSINQRRCNWTSVLHMQQYFHVGEVGIALQQVALRKQHTQFDQSKKVSKHSPGFRQGFKVENSRENQSPSVEPSFVNEDSNRLTISNGEMEKKEKGIRKTETQEAEENAAFVMDVREEEGDSEPLMGVDGEKKQIPSASVFVATETFDEKEVNVVEGLQLYERFFNCLEISALASFANELRDAGRRRELHGRTFVVSKRPSKGHGREMIRFGTLISNGYSEDGYTAGTSKDLKLSAIPDRLNDIFDHLMDRKIMTVRPDSCTIDFFNEGEYSQPHIYPSWYGRPLCRLFLTECSLVFGKTIGVDHPGNFTGSLKLSLSEGSLLVFQGNAADVAKHAIPSDCKSRIIITLMKFQPKKSLPPGSKHFMSTHASGVLSNRPIRAQSLSTPTPIQPPLFMPPPPVPYPPTIAIPLSSTGWSPVPPPRLMASGTGVFFPPGSGQPRSPHIISSNETISSTGTQSKNEFEETQI